MKKLLVLCGSLVFGTLISMNALAQSPPNPIYIDNIINNTTYTLNAVVLQGESRTIYPKTQSGPMEFKFFRPDYVFWMKLADTKTPQMCALIQVTNYRTPNYVLAGNFNCGITVEVTRIADDHYALTVKNK